MHIRGHFRCIFLFLNLEEPACTTTDEFKHYVSFFLSFFLLFLSQTLISCCHNAVLMLWSQQHFFRVKKTPWFCLNICFVCHKHGWKYPEVSLKTPGFDGNEHSWKSSQTPWKYLVVWHLRMLKRHGPSSDISSSFPFTNAEKQTWTVVTCLATLSSVTQVMTFLSSHSEC